MSSTSLGHPALNPFALNRRVRSRGVWSGSAWSRVITGVLAALCLIGISISASPASAAVTGRVYYVNASTGSDHNSGRSTSSPWRTLSKINSAALQPGDTVRLQRGQVWRGELSISRSGTSAAPILISSYGSGARPVITGGGSCVSVRGSWVNVRYLNATDCRWAGFDVSGDHVRVYKVTASRSVAGVYVAKSSSYAHVTHSYLHHNTKMSVLTKSPAYDDSGAFGVALNGDHTEVAYNTISAHNAFSYDFGTDGSAVEFWETSYNTVHHNTITGSSAFELGGKSSVGNVIIFNSVSSTLPTSEGLVTRGAADYFGPVRGTLFANNSLYLAGKKSKGVICYGGCSAGVLTVRNNIVVSPGDVVWADGKMTEDHNVFWGGGHVQLRLPLGRGSVIANPRLKNPTAADFRITPASPAYRRGVALKVPGMTAAQLTGPTASIGVHQP